MRFRSSTQVRDLATLVTLRLILPTDDWFVIAISDANFGRYHITADDLKRVLHRNPKVRIALICIGEGAEAEWIPKNFQGKGFRVGDTHEIPKVLRSILSSFIESR